MEGTSLPFIFSSPAKLADGCLATKFQMTEHTSFMPARIVDKLITASKDLQVCVEVK